MQKKAEKADQSYSAPLAMDIAPQTTPISTINTPNMTSITSPLVDTSNIVTKHGETNNRASIGAIDDVL